VTLVVGGKARAQALSGQLAWQELKTQLLPQMAACLTRRHRTGTCFHLLPRFSHDDMAAKCQWLLLILANHAMLCPQVWAHYIHVYMMRNMSLLAICVTTVVTAL